MRNLSDNIAQLLYQNKVIEKQDADVCRYGLEIFFSSVLEIASIFLISLLVGNFVETLLFFLIFIPLRMYAGGYHADTKLRCYLVSLLVYGLFTVLIFNIPEKFYFSINIAGIVLNLLIIMKFSPIIHKNRNMNKEEIAVYRKRSIIICVSQSLIIMVLSLFKNNLFIISLTLGQIAVTASMISALVKNVLQKNK